MSWGKSNSQICHAKRSSSSTRSPYQNARQVGSSYEKSKPSAPHLGKGDTTLNHIQLVLELSGTQSSTPECRAEHSNQILIDKSQLSPLCTQTPKSSAKSGEGLISSEKNCLPYWNESCKKLSALLLSHTKIDLPDSVLTTFSGYANNTGVKSWFSMRQTCLLKPRWLRISKPSSTVSALDSTVHPPRVCLTNKGSAREAKLLVGNYQNF